MFNSLKTKLLVYFFIANVIILVWFSFFLYSTAKNGVEQNLDVKLKILSQDAIVDLLEKNKHEASIISKELGKEFNIKPLHVKVIYYDSLKNKIIYEHISSNSLNEIFNIELHENSKLGTIYYYNKDEYCVSSMFLDKKGDVKIFFQLATTKFISTPYLQNLKLNLFVAIPIILILFMIIVNLLISKTFKPMKKVINSARQISTNNLSARVSSNNIPSEVVELVDTFNELLQNIEEAFSRVSTFSADASHELKTPLTVMRGEIEVMLKKDRNIQEYKTTLKLLLSETISIEETISQLFLLSKKDTLEFSRNIEEVYIDEIIDDIVKKQKKIANKKNINIIVDKLAPCSLHLNEALFKIAISNIIINSIIYSDEFRNIYISLSNENNVCLLKIIDSGCGISKENLPFIFDRFYRVDKTRNRQISGTGLGLSIVKMILDIYGFEININSEIRRGTTTVIKLNMNKS